MMVNWGAVIGLFTTLITGLYSQVPGQVDSLRFSHVERCLSQKRWGWIVQKTPFLKITTHQNGKNWGAVGHSFTSFPLAQARIYLAMARDAPWRVWNRQTNWRGFSTAMFDDRRVDHDKVNWLRPWQLARLNWSMVESHFILASPSYVDPRFIGC